MRTKAEKRHNDWKKAIRKRRIDRETRIFESQHDEYDNLHQYSKNKIRCSYCNRINKTNNKGHKRYLPKNYAPSKNWSPNDTRRIEEMEDQILDSE